MGERDPLARRGPSQIAEAIVSFFLPPACREEVLGDLWERYRSPTQYAVDALFTVPAVIAARIRRTADPQLLLMHAFAWYVSFLGAARFAGGNLLGEGSGLLRLGVPAAAALLCIVLDDAYSRPERRSPARSLRGLVLALAITAGTRGLLHLPLLVLLYGGGMSFLLSSGLRFLFPPVTSPLQAVNAPAGWLKRSGLGGTPVAVAQPPRRLAAIVVGVCVGAWMLAQPGVIGPRLVTLGVFTFVVYQAWKRK